MSAIRRARKMRPEIFGDGVFVGELGEIIAQTGAKGAVADVRVQQTNDAGALLVGDVVEDLVDLRRFLDRNLDRMAVPKSVGEHAQTEIIREKLRPDVVFRIDVIDG